MPEPRVPYAARNQAGAFTRRQALDDGWSERQVRRRLTARRWKVIAGSAFGRSDLEIGPWQLAFAARLSWPGAVVSHQVAAALRGWPVATGGIGTVTVPAARGVKARGLRAFRAPLDPVDVVRLGGLPVTTEARTAVDVLGSVPWDEARGLWAWLVTRRRMTIDGLDIAVDRCAGRPGVAQLRRLLAISATGSLSAAEDLLHALLRQAGLTGWEANVPVLAAGRVLAVVDVLFAAQRLVVEVDGWATHGAAPPSRPTAPGRTPWSRPATSS